MDVFDVGSIRAKIGADIKGFTSGMEKIKKDMSEVEDEGKRVEVGLKSMQGGLLAISAIASAALGATLKVAADFNNSLGMIAATTGQAVEDVAHLKENVDNIYRKGVGESYDEITRAISKASIMFKNTNDDIEEVTQTALQLQEIFGVGWEQGMKNASTAATNFKTTGTNVMNLIAKAAQQTQHDAGDIANAIGNNSTLFSELGFNAEQATQFIVYGLQNGVKSADAMANGIKQMHMRFANMTTDTQEALIGIGLDPNRIQRDILAGGESARRAMEQVFLALGQSGNTSTLNDLMGRQGAEFGMEFFRNFKNAGEIELNDLGDIVNKAWETAADGDPYTQFKQIRREFALMAYEVGNSVMPAVNMVLRIIINILQVFTNIIQRFPFIGQLIGLLLALLSIMGVIITTVLAINKAMAIWATFKAIIAGWTVALKAATVTQWAINAAMYANPVGLIVLAIVALIGLIGLIIHKTVGFKRAWEGVVNFFKAGFQVIKWVLDGVVFFFTDIIPKAVMNMIKFITAPLRTLLDMILLPLNLLGNFAGFNVPTFSALGDFAGGVGGNVSISNTINTNSLSPANTPTISNQLGNRSKRVAKSYV